jgi:hypothetical protein
MLDVVLIVKKCATVTCLHAAYSMADVALCHHSRCCKCNAMQTEVTFNAKCHHCRVFGQADLVSSLQARLDIIMAEAEEVLESSEAGGARHAILQSTSESSTYISLRLPTRVFFPVQVLDPFCSLQLDARWLEMVMHIGLLLSVGL